MNDDDTDTTDESVEGHGITDTGELSEAAIEVDETVEGHAVNHRPLDNGGTPGRRPAES
jgi:hypothetical protein